MNKFKLSPFILISCLCSCRRENVNNLRLLNNIYVNKAGNPYNGTAKDYYDSGELSSKFNFINGIPEGEWITYGFSGETIQSGNFKVYYLKLKRIGPATDVVRVNLDTFYEGNKRLTDICIVNNSFKKEFKEQDNPELFNEVISVLKSNNIPVNIKLIDCITFANGEMEHSK
jgi:antitoxin component YwqK of YwqJK toxin-antitoxin module